MLIDDYLPSFEFVERHATDIAADRPTVYAALKTADFTRSRVISCLLTLRSLPSALGGRRRRERAPGFTFERLRKAGFVPLAEDPPAEILIGVVGKFWTASGGRCDFTPDQFREFSPPGCAKAAWNFSLSQRSPESTRLATETRVLCLDRSSRRKFAAYWFIVRPFSGWIRMQMLAVVKQAVIGQQRARNR